MPQSANPSADEQVRHQGYLLLERVLRQLDNGAVYAGSMLHDDVRAFVSAERAARNTSTRTGE